MSYLIKDETSRWILAIFGLVLLLIIILISGYVGGHYDLGFNGSDGVANVIHDICVKLGGP